MTVPALVMLAVLIALASRARQLFLVSVRDGRVLLVQGRIPPALLDAFADIARDARMRLGSIRAVRDAERVRLVVRGTDDRVAQRFRNAFGVHPLAHLRAAPPPDDRNLGQLLGWTWLAWVLLGR